MQWKHLRIATFYALLLPYSKRARSKRMRLFAALAGLREGMRILDLGGQPMIWDSIPRKLDLTIVNLPGIANRAFPHTMSSVMSRPMHAPLGIWLSSPLTSCSATV